MKILTMFFLLFSLSKASMLLGTTNYCIEDYEFRGQDLYVQISSNLNWYLIGSNLDDVSQIYHGYTYDSANNICSPILTDSSSTITGDDTFIFNFMYALIGLIFGSAFMFASIYLFAVVGGKK